MLAHPLLVLAVLQHGAERGGDGRLVEVLLAEHGERRGPVDRLGHARRLVEADGPQRLDRGGHLAGQRSGTSGARSRTMATSRSKSGCSTQW